MKKQGKVKFCVKKIKQGVAVVLSMVMLFCLMADAGIMPVKASDSYKTEITGAALLLRYNNKSYTGDFYNLKLNDTNSYYVWDGAEWPGGIVKEDKTIPELVTFSIPQWSIANTAVAKFGADMGNNRETYLEWSEGYVQLLPVSEGQTTLTWSVGDLTKTVTIYVRKELATGLALNSGTTVTLDGKGKTSQISTTVYPATACQDCKYVSANPEVATVNEKGLIKAVGEGTARITITALGGNGISSRAVTVTVKAGTKEPETPDDPSDKETQKITTGKTSYTKAYGSKAFSLNAKTDGDGVLTYKSSNKKVVKVSAAGKVTITGTGKADITITASSTEKYQEAVRKVTVTVKPKKASLKKASAKKASLKITWAKDAKASGYQLVLATDSKFKKNKKTINIKSYKTVSTTVKKLKPKTTYYIKIASYKTVNGKKINGAYSKVLKCKTK